jgi:hypothetical protein
VGDFIIDIEVITKQDLISMRRILPSEEYRLFKNRKSARVCRRKRKLYLSWMGGQLEELSTLNTNLRKEIEKTQLELKNS